MRRLNSGDVYLIFDRYRKYSTKDTARRLKTAGASRVHVLNFTTPLPPQKVVLGVTENKKQIIHLICKDLLQDLVFNCNTGLHKLFLTGPEDIPFEISLNGVAKRHDMVTSHEQADNIIVQQAMKVALAGDSQVTVISDDPDVFLLLVHFYFQENITTEMLMESPVHGRTVVDIGAIVLEHRKIIPNILAAHAPSGCDTTASYFGIGKGKVVKITKGGYSLLLLGDITAPISSIIEQASICVTKCYGKGNCTTTTEARIKLWHEKMGKNCSQAPQLSSLPPTNEAFAENIKRAHLQMCVWKSALLSDPPKLDPTMYGYYKDTAQKTLVSLTLPEDVPLTPSEILKLIKCSCERDEPYKMYPCNCKDSSLPCTSFCVCTNIGCYSPITRRAISDEDGNSTDDDNAEEC